MRTVIHEIRNQLAVAVANIEAFVDGKLPPTQARLEGILQALARIDALVDELRPYLPVRERHSREVAAPEGAAGNVGAGVGPGLAMVKRFVEERGGG